MIQRSRLTYDDDDDRVTAGEAAASGSQLSVPRRRAEGRSRSRGDKSRLLRVGTWGVGVTSQPGQGHANTQRTAARRLPGTNIWVCQLWEKVRGNTTCDCCQIFYCHTVTVAVADHMKYLHTAPLHCTPCGLLGIMRPWFNSRFFDYGAIYIVCRTLCRQSAPCSRQISTPAPHHLTLKVKKGSPYSITERRVPELIPVFGSRPAGDVNHKPGSRLPFHQACSYSRNP